MVRLSSAQRSGLPVGAPVATPSVWPAWFGLGARLIVGVVWIWAGLLKLPDPATSIESVRAYELLPASLVEPVGYLLPALEVVIGLALVAGLMTRGSAVLSALLLVAFIIGISSAWARGLEINCGCFGDGGANPDAASQYPWEIARDVGLLALSIFLVRLRRSRFALDSFLFRPAAVSAPTDDLM
ncbi:DoxX family membrane protein [soil metagenome]